MPLSPTASAHDGPTLDERALSRLPIFPLPNVVLLPGVVIPLHLFEPRYQAMYEACRREGRVFALALAADPALVGADPAGPPPVYEVVCAGLVVADERLPDGRINLLLYGTDRLRIVRELETDEPFRRVDAERLPDVCGPDDDAAADRLRRVALQIADSVPGADRILGGLLAAARSPSHLGNLLAAHVADPISLRQACLENQHVASRLDDLTHALGAALLHMVGDSPPTPAAIH